MMYAYLFTLGLGGVLLLASIVLGGDGEADAHAGIDGHVGLDGDLALDGDVDAHADVDMGQQGLETHHADAHGAMDGFIAGFQTITSSSTCVAASKAAIF